MGFWRGVLGLVLMLLSAGMTEAVAKPTRLATRRPGLHVATRAHARSRTTARKRTASRAAASRTRTTYVYVRDRHGRRRRVAVRRPRYVERFTASSFAENLTLGDVTDGEDPVVRAVLDDQADGRSRRA